MKKIFTLTSVAALMALSSAARATDQDIQINATVAKFCSIDGANASATPATTTTQTVKNLTVSAAGRVSTSVVTAGPYAVVCNNASNVTLTSQNGAMTSGLTAVSGFENIINYSAATTGFAVASVDTSTVATATGQEGGATVGVGTAAAGNISVNITPADAGVLLAGTYQDVLRLSIVPQ
jgi:phosphotransferase system IIB component